MYGFQKKIKWVACVFICCFFLPAFKPIHRSMDKPVTDEGFAVVELFTSEGCSSCPPAEDLVGRLDGWKKNLYILSFHVDYWDYLGWKDIFSNPDYSERQQDYGKTFKLGSIYTPQIIVNGKTQFVGSDERRLKESIQECITEIPESEINIKIHRDNKNQISVSCITNGNSDLKINLALVQHRATDFIQRGENKGKTLNHFFTVREFTVIQNQNGSNTSLLQIPAGLNSSDCSVIAYLQNSKTGLITAATRSPLP